MAATLLAKLKHLNLEILKTKEKVIFLWQKRLIRTQMNEADKKGPQWLSRALALLPYYKKVMGLVPANL